MALTSAQIQQYYATEGKKANPLSPTAWLAQQTASTAPSSPTNASSGAVTPKTVQTPAQQVSDLTNKVNVAQQALGIKNQIDNLTAQKNALAQNRVSDTNDLPVAVKSQLGIDLVTSPSSTGNDALDKIQEGLQKTATDLINNGYTVPKTLEITPSLISQFLDQGEFIT